MSVCMAACLSVTLVHPAKTVGRNETPFGRDARVVSKVPNNVVDRGPSPVTGRGGFGNPLFTAML